MPNLSQFYPSEFNQNFLVNTTGSQTISGVKNFVSRIQVNGTGVLLSGEAEAVQTLTNVVFTTGNQVISGLKNFRDRPFVNNSGVLLQGEIIIPSNDPLFSGNRLITRQNIPYGLAVGGETVTEFLNRVFFPFIDATISLNEFPIFEYGVTYNGLTFSANVNKNSNTGVKNLQFLQNTTPLNLPILNINEGNNNLFISSFTINETQLNNIIPRIETGIDGTVQYLTGVGKSIIFEAPYYWGMNGSIISPNSTIIPSLTKVTGITKPDINNKFISLAYNPNGLSRYFYFVYPYGGSYGWNSSSTPNGNIISILDENGFENIGFFTTGSVFTHTFPNGKTANYIAYRTIDPINLPFTFKYYFFN